jgi:2-O-(6-phospho-alpha-D-mannosyl)-D-glycerate hydrolase
VSSAPRQAFLVSHTHWDREWYLPYSRFRVNLLEVVGKVLTALEDDPDFEHFVLDGQCAVLEDHLEAMPFDSPRVARLVREGALSLGPWYILPDEFLVSGEATVRNLIQGRKVARRFGAVQQAGYMPDSFGHLAQIPQILRLAGIDSFLFTRGMDDRAGELGWLFRWLGPDGSPVLAVNQCDGYCNAGGLGFAEIWHAHTRREVDTGLAVEKIGTLFDKMTARAGFEPALLNNGCDHFPPQQEFGKILTALRAAYPDTEFHHGGFEDFLAAARRHTPDQERPELTGELLGGRDHLILSGVWSARMYLKQENEICQNLLQRYMEPLAAMTALNDGEPWPGGLLDTTWRELLRNHPHDSICGCSTDEVHREMVTRFACVNQTANQYVSRLMDRLAPTFARREEDDRTTLITVANPLPMTRDEVVERLVVLQPLGYDLDNLRLVDEDGAEVPCRVVERRFLERFWGIDYRAENFHPDQQRLLDVYLARFGHRIVGTEADQGTKDSFLSLQFLARDLPALGHKQYFLTDEPGNPRVGDPPPVSGRIDSGACAAIIESELVSVTLYADGRFDLLDKATDCLYTGLNRLEDTEDVGDEYDYSPAAHGRTIYPECRDGSVGIVQDSGLLVRAEAVCALELPNSISPDRERRTTKTSLCTVRVQLTLRSGSPLVEIETVYDNHAEDHRLRVEFPTGMAATEVFSDGQFMINRRPVIRPSNPAWDQPAPPTWPQQDFSLIQDRQGGLAILNRGLPEFETRYDDKGEVIYSLTLLRAVGWLSRDDFPTRNCTNAGPTLFTPQAQCPGPRTYCYAVVPFAGDHITADIKSMSERYRTPPVTHQGTADQMRPGGQSLLEKTAPQAAISAIVMADSPTGAAEETGDRLIVRLYNQTDEVSYETLRLGRPVLQAMKVDFFEDALLEGMPGYPDRGDAAVTHGGRRVRVPLEAFEIATMEITFEPKDES